MKTKIVALVGNPNCGKSTLFNLLTKSHQAVGNWSGVTVEQKRGRYEASGISTDIIDLPGCYSCIPSDEHALDEHIACEFLSSDQANLVVNVVDATHLSRHLFLTLQLLERGLPVIIALNRMDVAKQKGLSLDIQALEQQLGCPVIPIVATKNEGVETLKAAINTYHNTISSTTSRSFSCLQDACVETAQTRFDKIHTLLSQCIQQTPTPKSVNWTTLIDSIILNRFLGIPLFLAMMYLMFLLAIHMGGLFQDFFDIGSRTLFIEGLEQGLIKIGAPVWLIGLLATGIGQGINTTVSFIPVIASMFLCLSFLEASGYMARAAFIMDRIMQWVGLPGKSFVPMILGFGCNVPAILGARTLENREERILTILMSPFMSCGARLAIYTLFVSAFFPQGGQNIIFGLYMIGILVALMTGLMLRSTLLQGERSPFIMELPAYRWPLIKHLWRTTWHRLKRFILKAGSVIVPLCAVIGLMGSLQPQEKNWIASLGKTLTPIFAPMGIEEDNWPATVGLLTGVLAKEVVVGTLNALYAEEGHLQIKRSETEYSLKRGLKKAVDSIFENASQLEESIRHPLLSIAPESDVEEGVLGVMATRFGSPVAAFAYLLFILLYFPCVSVVATIGRELNKSWALFSMAWTTGLAYGVSVFYYQSATFSEHPVGSLIWIVSLTTTLTCVVLGIRKRIQQLRPKRPKRVPTQILIVS